MNQNISVEAIEIVDVMQREKNKVLGGSVIIIDNYFGSNLPAIYPIMLWASVIIVWYPSSDFVPRDSFWPMSVREN